MVEPIFMQIDTTSLLDEGMKRPAFGVRRSKLRVTFTTIPFGKMSQLELSNKSYSKLPGTQYSKCQLFNQAINQKHLLCQVQ